MLIEFEDAKHNSIFSNGTNQYRYWARRLEHGIGQAVDPAWLQADDPSAAILTNAFGGSINDSAYVGVCGRDAGIGDDIERCRFDFRRYGMTIEGLPIRILTYDNMIEPMEQQLETVKSFAQP